MRRGFVVLALLATMVGLRALQTDGAAGGDPMTLAAIGFVVLAAFAVAELGGRLGLPRVTGYIVSGVALGPFALGVLSPGTVGDLEMFSTLALGLIATSAGLELDLRGLRSLARTLGVTIAVKVALGLLVVGGAVFAIESQFDVLGLAEAGPRVAVAVVIAALTIGTSPAIALALISETGAKGRLADLVLGAAVVKDLVVVIALAVAVATGRAVLSGDAFDVAVLGHVGLDLAGSATAGAALGALLIAYVRYVKAEMLLFVAAMVLVVAEVSTALHLEVLLVFIVAGAVVRNYSRYEHDLLHPLHMVSLPVFIVFFTTAGANVDVAATIGVLPLALTVCLLRAGVYAIAGRIGGRVGGEEPVVRRLAWLGYLPQAGVALGLLAIAVDQLPEIAGPLATLGMAVIAINLMVGPITLRTALTRAGDASRPAPAPVEPPRDAGASSFGGARPLADLALHEIVATLDAALRAMLEGPIASPLERWLRDRVELARPALSGNAGDAGRGETHARAASVLAAAARLQADDGVPDVNGMLDAFDRQLERLLTLPTALVTPLDPALARVAPNDPVVVKLRKRGAWFA
ncbi:MAG: cation:proton antiporter, partial [Myxococcales bacterium]|nr:cation:proton antiporter [Myxococcales bacterium]